MRAIVYDGRLRVVGDHPEPSLRQGWAVIAVQLAGICRTDLEIVAGYMGFRGVLGHEFVGQVIACGESPWVGRRVVGEINASCGDCRTCASGMDRHCPSRTVLGILGLDGCLAERCALPVRNLHSVPAELSDAQAVFCEPLAAAYEMLEQIRIEPGDRCVVLGDGKLGILCAWVLATVSGDVTLMGRHPAKLDLARWGGVRCCAEVEDVLQADVVVEATGTPGGIMRALP
ncbi:MAG: alcohol dehydrogenase, partial [Armatimonadetes bacterium]|nr:alcohol dehydrogenase [Armatimonadota bacterium]